MINKYHSQRDIQTELFEELGRVGFKISEYENGRYILLKGQGRVYYFPTESESDRDGFTFCTMPKFSFFLPASIARTREVDRIVKKLNGSSEDILKGVLPDKDRKLLRIGGAMLGIPMLIGIVVYFASYLIFGTRDYIFEETQAGMILATILSATWFIGFCVCIAKVSKMEKEALTKKGM